MIKEAIIKVAKKEDLLYEESKAVMNEICLLYTSPSPRD